MSEMEASVASKLRAWHGSNLQTLRQEVATPEDAVRVLDHWAARDLRNPHVVWNAQGLEEWDGTEWTEWYNEVGEDIDALRERLWRSSTS